MPFTALKAKKAISGCKKYWFWLEAQAPLFCSMVKIRYTQRFTKVREGCLQDKLERMVQTCRGSRNVNSHISCHCCYSSCRISDSLCGICLHFWRLVGIPIPFFHILTPLNIPSTYTGSNINQPCK